jgi:hypothetical protein
MEVARRDAARFRRTFHHDEMALRRIDRKRLRSLFRDACSAGDSGACWLSPQFFAPDGPSADESLLRQRSQCVSGDELSCRALPPDRTLEYDRAIPGWAGRSLACQKPELERCDVTMLRDECDHDFAQSCLTLVLRVSSDAERDSITLRAIELARSGCRMNVMADCHVLTVLTTSEQQWDIQPQLCVFDGHCDYGY